MGVYSGHGFAVLRLGVVADPQHLAPSGIGPLSYHNAYRMEDAGARFRLALARCAREGVNAVALPGDLSHFGDEGSLAEGVQFADESGVPVLVVAGNHDVFTMCWGAPGPSPRHSLGGFGVGGWDEGPAVVVTHYPVVSLVETVAAEGFKYPGGLEDLLSVAGALLRRNGADGGRPRPRTRPGRLGLGQSAADRVRGARRASVRGDIARHHGRGDGGRVSVRRECVRIAPSPDGARLPVLSPREQGWTFE